MSKVLVVHGMDKCIGCFTCMTVCAAVNEQSHSLNRSRIKIRTSGGLQGRFVADVCNGCTGERPCVEACLSGALAKRPGGGVTFKPERCIGCRRCVEACSIRAVHFDEISMTPLICKHCGVCARFCPHDCLKMEEREDD